MTSAIEDTLGLPPMNKDDSLDMVSQEISDLNEDVHSHEMDEVFREAVNAHKLIVDYAMNVEAKQAGIILAQGASYLDIAQKASRSKADIKSKAKDLRLKAEALRGKLSNDVVDVTSEETFSMTRNQLFAELQKTNEQNHNLNSDDDSQEPQ